MILNGAFAAGHYIIGAAVVLLLLIIFLGMGRIVLSAVLGRPKSPGVKHGCHEGYLRGAPVLVSLVLVLLLGLYLPPPLRSLLNHAGTYLGMKP